MKSSCKNYDSQIKYCNKNEAEGRINVILLQCSVIRNLMFVIAKFKVQALDKVSRDLVKLLPFLGNV